MKQEYATPGNVGNPPFGLSGRLCNRPTRASKVALWGCRADGARLDLSVGARAPQLVRRARNSWVIRAVEPFADGFLFRFLLPKFDSLFSLLPVTGKPFLNLLVHFLERI